MKGFFGLSLLLVAFACVSVDAVPTPLNWPTSFKATFNVTDTTSIPGIFIIGAASTMYYDWTYLSQRVDFTMCDVVGSEQIYERPCTMIFSSNKTNFGIYIYNDTDCCQQFANLGNMPPNWTSQLKFIEHITVFGEDAYHFQGGAPATHDYFTTTGSQQPLFISPENWSWTSPFITGALQQSLFNLPNNCTTKCAGAFPVAAKFAERISPLLPTYDSIHGNRIIVNAE